MRRWILLAVVVFAVIDLGVLAVGYRARAGVLPPWQVEKPRFSMAPASEPAASESPAPTITGPVMLAVDASGLVIRATRGACEARFDSTAVVAVGQVRSSDGLTTVEVPDVVEVLGVAVLPDGHLRVAGLDSECHAVYVDSTDGGRSWERQASAGIWRLAPDTTADAVSGPLGKDVATPCVPSQVVNLPDGRALVSCGTGTFYVLGSNAKPAARAAGGFTSLTVAPGARAGDFYAFGTTADCLARVGSVVIGRAKVALRACLGDDDLAPLAIASAGNLVVVQVGELLQASEDGASSFDTVG